VKTSPEEYVCDSEVLRVIVRTSCQCDLGVMRVFDVTVKDDSVVVGEEEEGSKGFMT